MNTEVQQDWRALVKARDEEHAAKVAAAKAAAKAAEQAAEARREAKREAKAKHSTGVRRSEFEVAVSVAESTAIRDGQHICLLTSPQIVELRSRGLTVEVHEHRVGAPPLFKVSDPRWSLSRWEQADATRRIVAAPKLNTMASQLDAVFKK